MAVLNANPYFETDAAGWSGLNCTVARSTVRAHEGTASLLVTPDGVSASIEARAEFIAATPGQPFRASSWVWSTVARSVGVGIIYRDAGGAFLTSSVNTVSVPAGTWTFITCDGVVPAGASQVQLIGATMGGTPPASNTVWIDESKLTLLLIEVGVTDNGSYHSPGFDLTVNELTGYDTLTIERTGVPDLPDTPVRGADRVAIAANSFAISDYEAPIGRSILYRATASTRKIADNFNRTISNGLGVTSGGQLGWDTSVAPTRFSTNGTVALVSLESIGLARNAVLTIPAGASAVKDSTVAIRSKIPATPSGAPVRAGVIARYVDFNNYYLAELSFEPTGPATIRIQKCVGGVLSVIGASVSTGLAVGGVSWYWLKISVVGNSIQAKAWIDGNAEPTTWQVSTTDSSITAAGSAGFQGIVAPGNLNTLPYVVQFDDFAFSSVGAEAVLSQVAFAPSAVSIPAPWAGAAWLKSVSQPALSTRVNIVDFDDVSRPGRVLGEYSVLGRRNKVVITDTLGGREGKITLVTYREGGGWASDCPPKQLREALEEGGTMLLQSTGEQATGEEDMYFEITDVSRKRVGIIADNDMVHLTEVQFIEVDRPASTELSLGLRSWNDVLGETSWDAVLSAYTDWLDVLQRSA